MKATWDGLIAFLGTDQLDETDRFYRELLGLPLYKDQGLCRIYTIPGGGRLGFCSHMSVQRDPEKNSPILTLLTEDVDGVYQRLVEAGYEIPHAPQENGQFKIYHFFMEDPNGYTVEIQRFLD